VKRIASKSAPSPTNPISAEDAIDVVIAWVDGRDPQHRRKRQRYLADPGADEQPEQVASKERRFSDNDEIRLCLRSIRNYAPWVRSIWLVTDDQVPASIDRQQAELDNIRIVDHRQIFRATSNCCRRSTRSPSKPCCGASTVWPIGSCISTTT
jgi:hypothetical protein